MLREIGELPHYGGPFRGAVGVPGKPYVDPETSIAARRIWKDVRWWDVIATHANAAKPEATVIEKPTTTVSRRYLISRHPPTIEPFRIYG